MLVSGSRVLFQVLLSHRKFQLQEFSPRVELANHLWMMRSGDDDPMGRVGILYIGSTWRIIPVSKWLITMVIVSPLSRVVPLPNGLFMAYKWGLLTTY